MENEILNIDGFNEQAEGTPEEPASSEAFRIFKTQEDFQKCIDKALGKRLLKAREQDEELSLLKDKVSALCSSLGCESIEEIAALKDAPKSEEPMPSAEKIAEMLSQDIGKAESLLANERFCFLYKNGANITEAYNATSLSQILESEEQRIRNEVIREIRLKGIRPDEDAVSGYGSFSATLDPKNLSPQQRNEIRERVRRGERVTF